MECVELRIARSKICHGNEVKVGVCEILKKKSEKLERTEQEVRFAHALICRVRRRHGAFFFRISTTSFHSVASVDGSRTSPRVARVKIVRAKSSDKCPDDNRPQVICLKRDFGGNTMEFVRFAVT